MREIPLNKGKFALVDDQDYEWLMQWRWTVSAKGYATRTSKSKGVTRKILMHRLINNTPDGMQTDHINHNPLDNRRSNLRTVSHVQNSYNKKAYPNNKSGYKGVCWDRGAWHVQIQVNKKKMHLGRFKDIRAAAMRYNGAAKQFHGEYARLNEVI